MLLDIVQIILAIILIAVVLLQSQGAGLGAAFGGENNVYRTKRGPEKALFVATIITSALFLITSLVNAIF